MSKDTLAHVVDTFDSFFTKTAILAAAAQSVADAFNISSKNAGSYSLLAEIQFNGMFNGARAALETLYERYKYGLADVKKFREALEKFKDIYDIMYFLIKEGCPGALNCVLAQGVSPDLEGKDNIPLLYLAANMAQGTEDRLAKKQYRSCIRSLLLAGANFKRAYKVADEKNDAAASNLLLQQHNTLFKDLVSNKEHLSMKEEIIRKDGLRRRIVPSSPAAAGAAAAAAGAGQQLLT